MLSAVADSSGRLHALTAGTAGNLRYFYQRFELLRANGHVTGLHRAIDPIALPDHGRHPSADLRGDLIIATNSGQNVVVYAYDTSVGTSLDNVRVFAGRSTNALPMTSADFTGIDGAGGDSLLFRSDGGTVLISHLMQALVVQGRASEDLFFVVGQLNGDHVVPIAPTPDYALRAIPARKQTTGWTIAAPVIIAAAGGVEPQLLDVHSSTLAWVMYLDPVSGIRFGSFDAQGAFTSRPGPIESGAGMRAAFGSFTADGSGRIWAVWHTYGHANALSPLGGMSAFDGTAWSTTRDPNPIDCNGFGSTDGLERGAAAVRFDGQLLPQINDLPSVGSFIQR